MSTLAEWIGWVFLFGLFIYGLFRLLRFIALLFMAVMMVLTWRREEKR